MNLLLHVHADFTCPMMYLNGNAPLTDHSLVTRPDAGAAPEAWEVEAVPDRLFQDQTQYLEVPHTAAVRKCYHCAAYGPF